MSAAGKVDRAELVKDADYFAGELLKRVERLARLDGRHEVAWRQSAVLVRRVRAAARVMARLS